MAFQRRTWAVERASWALMGAFLVAALAGGFSRGPLSTAEAADERGFVHVQYERFLRVLSPTTLRVSLAPEATSRSEVAIRLTGDVASAMKVEKVVPEPMATKVAPGGLEFVFAVSDPGKPASIAIYLQAQSIGRIAGAIGVPGQEPARIDSFVYP